MIDADAIENVESSATVEEMYRELDGQSEIPSHDYFLMASDKTKRDAAEAAVALANATGEVVQLHHGGMSVTVFTGTSPGKVEKLITGK